MSSPIPFSAQAQQKPYRELTLISSVLGVLIGALMNAAFVIALKLGFSLGGSTVAAIIGFGVLKTFVDGSSIIENNINIRKEIFLDRNYNNDNTLVSRTKANAIINSSELMFERINSLINNGYLISAFGKRIFLEVDTFCIHGDSPNILDCLKGLNRLYNAKI